MVLGEETVFQGGVVFDDAVVDNGELARTIGVRMRVALRRNAVGGPASVTKCCVAPDGLMSDGVG